LASASQVSADSLWQGEAARTKQIKTAPEVRGGFTRLEEAAGCGVVGHGFCGVLGEMRAGSAPFVVILFFWEPIFALNLVSHSPSSPAFPFVRSLSRYALELAGAANQAPGSRILLGQDPDFS
jgi:hypothetical protein